ncbi:phosphatidylserine/phosphatidylglycerophosphate/cardiolipin synthase-like enzyme [Kribbella steppae]|uniref:Phosphatidylserine/phosphatidylglycerophosphate/ cardiolipin synthase-like enzyme n=1 Tax=Kribbella steppae TaxID=2512223 RepID=A0A4R2H5W7_9ACTN|nr:phospholipase D-like domain-containing protein [Kribbella steppae]TCO20428.1 phosphatidylserine/phosphatidylglycerophosphate/cardiolipin synthase-like enzyme [Kribbella steppae]
MTDHSAGQWFLRPEERGNPGTDIDRMGDVNGSWVEGNLVRPLIHGVTYFRRLYEELCVLQAGDHVYFTDWRGDADQLLLPEGPTIGEVLCDLARSGIEVRALLWRSHSDHLQFSSRENQRLGTELNEAGAEVLLDQRVRRLSSHHQKLFIIRHRGQPERDVAYVGGIDLSHQRRDDREHRGDPQQAPMDRRYGDRTPWHDAALELRGPVVGDLLRTFVERWDDRHPLDRRTPYRMLVQRLARMPRHPEPLTESFPDPPPAGPHAVQVLRTYAYKHPGYPFAPKGERSIARAYHKAFAKARSLIYLEDQYLWSELIAQGILEALQRSPGLRVIIVVPRYPDSDGAVSGPPARFGQLRAVRMLRRAEPGRVGIYNLENSEGSPIYVHAKICVVDDVWFTCGSDNFNRRSWTSDSELTCAVVDSTPDDRQPDADGGRRLARDLRLDVWSEHLGRPIPDLAPLDPAAGFDLWQRTAADLEAWHAGGKKGERPPGQIRPHEPQAVTRWQALWAEPLYRLVYDPDGRPRGMRRRGEF